MGQADTVGDSLEIGEVETAAQHRGGGQHAATLVEAIVAPRVHDRMTQAVIPGLDSVHTLFDRAAPRPLQSIEVVARGLSALEQANRDMGLALSDDEIGYFWSIFSP